MAESEVKLEKGMVTYNPTSMDYKQQFFIDAFSDMEALLEGVKQLASFSKDMYENSSATMRGKIENVPDFDAITNGVDRLLEKYESCCGFVSSDCKHIEPAVIMTAEELSEHDAKLLKELEELAGN